MNMRPNCTYVGKKLRLSRFFSRESGKTVIVPIDDSLINGPFQGLNDLEKKILQIVKEPPNAIMGFIGAFCNFSGLISAVPIILNLTASTTQGQHTKKMLVSTVNQAIQLGADAVAVHVNISSKYEPDMLHNLGIVVRECENLGMPVLAIMYLRTEGNEGDDNYLELKKNERNKYAELVAHASRIGVEMGADIIKTQYTGDPDTFKNVVEACKPIPVVAAGGPLIDIKLVFQMAYDIVKAGGAGVSFGRNVFNSPETHLCIRGLKSIVHENLVPERAVEIMKVMDVK